MRRHGGSRGLTQAPPDRAELRALRRALRDAFARYAAAATKPDPQTGESRSLAVTTTQVRRGLLRSIQGPAGKLGDKPDDLARRRAVYDAVPAVRDVHRYTLAARMAGGADRLHALLDQTHPDELPEPLSPEAIEAAHNLACAEWPTRPTDAPTPFADPPLADLALALAPIWQRVSGRGLFQNHKEDTGRDVVERKRCVMRPWLADLFGRAGWRVPSDQQLVEILQRRGDRTA